MKFKMQLFSTQTHSNSNELYFDEIKVKLIIVYKTFYKISWQYIIIIYFWILLSFIIHFETVYNVNTDWKKIVFSSYVLPIHNIPLSNDTTLQSCCRLSPKAVTRFTDVWNLS